MKSPFSLRPASAFSPDSWKSDLPLERQQLHQSLERGPGRGADRRGQCRGELQGQVRRHGRRKEGPPDKDTQPQAASIQGMFLEKKTKKNITTR